MIIKSILPVLAVLSFVDNCVVHAVERNLAPKSSKSDGKASKKESEHGEVSAKAFKSDGKASKMAKSKAGESFDAKAEKIGSKAAKAGNLFSKAAKASPGIAPPDNAEPMTLTILHMNDSHSHIDEEDKKIDVTNLDFSNGFTAEDDEIKVFYGGFPRIVSLFEMLSQEAKDEGHEVVKVHAGDAITGTSYYSLFGGDADAQMMSQICFDSFTLETTSLTAVMRNLLILSSNYKQVTRGVPHLSWPPMLFLIRSHLFPSSKRMAPLYLIPSRNFLMESELVLLESTLRPR